MTVYKHALQPVPAFSLEDGMLSATREPLTRVHRQGEHVHFVAGNRLCRVNAGEMVTVCLPYAVYAMDLEDGMEVCVSAFEVHTVRNVRRELGTTRFKFTVLDLEGYEGSADAQNFVEVPEPDEGTPVVLLNEVVQIPVRQLEAFEAVHVDGQPLKVSSLDLPGQGEAESDAVIEVVYPMAIQARHVQADQTVRVDLQGELLVMDTQATRLHRMRLISSAGSSRELGTHEILELL